MDLKVDTVGLRRLIRNLDTAPQTWKREGKASFEAMARTARVKIQVIMPYEYGHAKRSWGTPGAGTFGFEYRHDEWINIVGGIHYIEYLAEGSSPQQPEDDWMWKKVLYEQMTKFGSNMAKLVAKGL